MKFKRVLMNTLIASALLSFGVQAEKTAALVLPVVPAATSAPTSAMVVPPGANKAAMESVLKNYQLNIESIALSPLKGMYEVLTDGGVIYANNDASYFVYGQLFETKNNIPVNLTERTLAKRNKAMFDKSILKEDLIVYPAKNEKHVVNVFTDTSCGYCVKLHSEMKDYNALGITVRYIPFPRSGERSANLEQMSAIWCADDKIKAMDLAKAGKFNEKSNKCTDKVLKYMKVGNSMGVSGTPAILLEDGTILSGYMPAKQLISALEAKAAK